MTGETPRRRPRAAVLISASMAGAMLISTAVICVVGGWSWQIAALGVGSAVYLAGLAWAMVDFL